MGWWIALGILLLFYLLFRFSVTLYVSWGEQTEVAIGAAGFRKVLIPEPKPKKPAVKKKKPAKPKVASTKKEKTTVDFLKEIKAILSDGKEQSVPELITSLLQLLTDFWTPVKRLLGAIRIEVLNYELWVGAEDAHQVAVQYAAWAAGFYNGLAVLQQHLAIRCRHVAINADFTSPKIRQRGSLKIKLRFSKIAYYGLRLLWQVVKRMLHRTKAKESTAA